MEAASAGSAVTVPLSSERAAEVHALVAGCCNEDVVPPGYSFSYEDALDLFKTQEGVPYGELSGVVGALDETGALEGVVAIQPFELDGRPCLEFMIFFRRSARGSGAPLLIADAVLRRVRARCDAAVVTLVHEGNTKGKRFYGRAGFEYDRMVRFDEFTLELWKFKG